MNGIATQSLSEEERVASPVNDLDESRRDPELGFLPAPDPLDRLPEDFASWEEIAERLPKLLAAGRIRAILERLPVLDANRLEEDRQNRRAMLLL